MQFTFRTAGQICFEAGARRAIGKLVAPLSQNVALFTGGESLRKSGELDRAIASLQAEGVHVTLFDGIHQEPDCETVDRLVRETRAAGCRGIVAIGGGSVMDVGKSVAGLVDADGGVRDYLDGVGIGKELQNPSLPFAVLPTTSGTGSETTNNAVLISRAEGWKRSIRDDKLLPALVIVDPELMLALPPAQTAESGMDTVAQLIEAYTSRCATAMSDTVALSGLAHASALPKAFSFGASIDARSSMAFASLMSGIAITQGGVTACHGLASGFGGALGVPHGRACAILLPHVMQLNRDALPERYRDIAERLTGKRFSDVQEGAHVAVETVREWLATMGIPEDFSDFQVGESDIDRILAGSSASGLSKNPVRLDDDGWRRFVTDLV